MNHPEHTESEVTLPTRLTASAVVRAHADLLGASQREGLLVVNGGNVEVADAAGVQLVAAVLLGRANTTLRASPVLAELLTLTGLASLAS